MQNFTRIVLAGALTGMVFGAGQVGAQEVEPEPGTVEETALAEADAVDPVALALSQLNDVDPAVREDATFALMRVAGLDEAMLMQWYGQATTPEAKVRVLRVAEQWSIADAVALGLPAFDPELPEPGAMGMSHILAELPPEEEGGEPRRVVQVVRTLPGFPAHVWLREGDFVLAIGQDSLEAIESAEGYTEAVRAIPAGQAVTLEVLRGETTLEVTMTLARRAGLSYAYDRNQSLSQPCQGAWRSLRHRIEMAHPSDEVLILPTSPSR